MPKKQKLSKKDLKILEKRENKKKDKLWRMEVLNKFDNTCAFCPEIKRINAHHIVPKEFKELRWDRLNGIALCPKHHKFGKFSAHRNPLWFFHHLRKIGIYINEAYLLEKINENFMER